MIRNAGARLDGGEGSFMNKEKINTTAKQTDDRAGKMKLYSIGSVVLLIAIILLVNILFERIFGSALSFDFSDTAQNSLSQASVDYLDSLPADTRIRIVGLFNRPTNVSGTSYQYIVPLLDDYVRKSDGKITLDYVDITENPSIISQLDPTNSYDLSSKADSYVIAYNGRIKIIDPIECYTYDEEFYKYYGQYYVTGNNTEFTFTNAMNNLTGNYSFKAYIVTGLKEEGNSYITKILDSMGMEVAELPVSGNFVIPDDCDLLILNGPNSDISENMYVAMTDYLTGGGKMFVAVDYNITNVSEKYTRLNQLLSLVNISIDPVLISENDPAYQLGGYSTDSTVQAADDFSSYSSIKYLHNSYARYVRVIENFTSSIDTVPVLLTSKKASLVELDDQGNSIESDIDTENQYSVAAYSKGTGSDPVKVYVFGTMNFSSDEYISSYGLSDTNVDFFKSCIRDLSSTKAVNSMNIATKQINSFSIDTQKSTTAFSTAILIVFMIIVPILLVAAAVIVYFKRKNL